MSDQKRALTSVGALFLCLMFIGGCSGTRLSDARVYVNKTAREMGFVTTVHQGDFFALQTMLFEPRTQQPNDILRVYIEGDGRSWVTPSQPSADPTPFYAVGFDLAVLHAKQQVPTLYIARPCQYVLGQDRRNCQPAFWTAGRFSEEVVAAIDAAIDDVLSKHPYSQIDLVGFSGGGALAVILATRRQDVRVMVTVAGVLDHEAWTEHHGVSRLNQSVNPADLQGRIVADREIYIFGEDDDIVPANIFSAFLLNRSEESEVVIDRHSDHLCCWAQNWPKILKDLGL